MQEHHLIIITKNRPDATILQSASNYRGTYLASTWFFRVYQDEATLRNVFYLCKGCDSSEKKFVVVEVQVQNYFAKFLPLANKLDILEQLIIRGGIFVKLNFYGEELT